MDMDNDLFGAFGGGIDEDDFDEDCPFPFPVVLSSREVDGMEVPTASRYVAAENKLYAEAGTTGDIGDESRVYVKLGDMGHTHWHYRKEREIDGGESLVLTLRGQSELYTFEEALRWLLFSIESMHYPDDDTEEKEEGQDEPSP